jgi:hypothetical protein
LLLTFLQRCFERDTKIEAYRKKAKQIKLWKENVLNVVKESDEADNSSISKVPSSNAALHGTNDDDRQEVLASNSTTTTTTTLSKYDPKKEAELMRKVAIGKDLDDVMVKLVRVLANLSIELSVGQAMSTREELKVLVALLARKSDIEQEELVLNVISCITNISFYYSTPPANMNITLDVRNMHNSNDNKQTDNSNVLIFGSNRNVVSSSSHPSQSISAYKPPTLFVMHRQILARSMTFIFSSNHEIVNETVRAYGNFSRDPAFRQDLISARVDEALIVLTEHEDWPLLHAVAGVLLNLAADRKCKAAFRRNNAAGTLSLGALMLRVSKLTQQAIQCALAMLDRQRMEMQKQLQEQLKAQLQVQSQVVQTNLQVEGDGQHTTAEQAEEVERSYENDVEPFSFDLAELYQVAELCCKALLNLLRKSPTEGDADSEGFESIEASSETEVEVETYGNELTKSETSSSSSQSTTSFRYSLPRVVRHRLLYALQEMQETATRVMTFASSCSVEEAESDALLAALCYTETLSWLKKSSQQLELWLWQEDEEMRFAGEEQVQLQ